MRVQARLLKTPRVQIVALRQCVCVSGRELETHTLTLFLVRERASIAFRAAISCVQAHAPNSSSTVSGQGQGI
jgi:hypothetical protein